MSERTSERATAVVIGSGFGGSIAARHLGEAGIQTVVLERGRRWPVTDAQDTFCTYRQPDGRAAWLSDTTVAFEPKPIDKHVGLVQQLVEDGITVWCPAAVGGGSLVYNTVLLQPTRANFERVFPPSVDYDEMDQVFYPRVIERLKAGQIPDDVLKTDHFLSTRVFMEQGEKAGLTVKRVDLGSDWEVVRQEIRGEKKPSAIAGEIWYGINSGVKNSLDRTYLADAEACDSVEVRPLHVVTDITEGHGGEGFTVSYDVIDEAGVVQSSGAIECQYLFMGAGSIGTSKLLVRAKGKGALPRLNSQVGAGWGNNGDTFATRDAGCRTNPGEGGPATVAIHHHDNPFSPQTFIVYPEWDAPEGTLTSLGMTIPDDRGEFTYDAAADRVDLHWPGTGPGAQKLLDAANHTYALLDQARDQLGGEEVYAEFSGHMNCPINGFPEQATTNAAKPVTQANGGITAHPCGGVVVGQACDNFGRVHGYDGLYVVDGALIPGSTAACNPALTIAAMAERCLDRIIAEDLAPATAAVVEVVQ